jgi:hypothetical protein
MQKMMPIKTVPGIREVEMKESKEGGEFKHDILDTCKNRCKCYNVPYPAQKLKENRTRFQGDHGGRLEGGSS